MSTTYPESGQGCISRNEDASWLVVDTHLPVQCSDWPSWDVRQEMNRFFKGAEETGCTFVRGRGTERTIYYGRRNEATNLEEMLQGRIEEGIGFEHNVKLLHIVDNAA